jgi:hypothetical protein
MLLCNIAHTIICTRLFRGKMYSDWFSGIEILQRRRQHGEKVGYCYPSEPEKTLCKWDIYVSLVMKGLMKPQRMIIELSYCSPQLVDSWDTVTVVFFVVVGGGELEGYCVSVLGTWLKGDSRFVKLLCFRPSVSCSEERHVANASSTWMTGHATKEGLVWLVDLSLRGQCTMLDG